MELQRASLIINTPPATPRNSLLLPVPPPSNSSQMFDLQEFLSKFDPGDSPGTIPEHEELKQLSNIPSREFKSSQQSVSQRSKSSSSLHSAPSQTSISSKNDGGVIINPGTNGNFNNNNSNPSVLFSDSTSQLSLPASSTPNGETKPTTTWKETSTISSHSDTRVQSSKADDQLSLTEALAFLEPLNDTPDSRARSKTLSVGSSLSRSKSSDTLKRDGKSKGKGRGLFKRNFHKSSDVLGDESITKPKGKSGKPPVVKPAKRDKRKPEDKRNSSTSLEVPPLSEKRRSIPNLSALTQISQPLEDDGRKRLSFQKLPSTENLFLDERDPFTKTDQLSSLSQPANLPRIGSLITDEESIWQEYGPF